MKAHLNIIMLITLCLFTGFAIGVVFERVRLHTLIDHYATVR